MRSRLAEDNYCFASDVEIREEKILILKKGRNVESEKSLKVERIP